VSEVTATRSAVIALKEEHRAMQEGSVFLDEKCLLLAGAMLRELRRFDAARAALRGLLSRAAGRLAAAVARHGLQELQCHPVPASGAPGVKLQRRSLMGLVLVDATAAIERTEVAERAHATPEAESCRDAFSALAAQLAEMAAMSGNLERLYREYRKSVRRVRALQDVLLPELDRNLYEIETQLDELEQDEAISIRKGARLEL